MNSSNDTSKAIIVKIQGGLGNQLFQYALGRNLALTHGLPVTYDTSWYAMDMGQTKRTYELDHFQTRVRLADPAAVQELRRYQRKAGPVGFLKSFLTADESRYIQDYNYAFDPKIFQVKPPAYLDGYWQSEKYFSDVAEMIRREIALTRAPTGKNAEALSQIQSSPSISLHIRRGDYVTSKTTNTFHGAAGLNYYHAASAKLKSVEPKATMYVFSDDLAWVKENLRSDLPTVFVDWNTPDTAHEDLRLMSACRHHVLANSTFSWWGAWLSPNPDKVVIAPEQWFADPKMRTDDLLPKTWLRM